MPLSATVTSAEIEEECYEKGYTYYTSHLSDPLAAEVGCAVLEVILTEKLVEKANDLGEHLRAGLRELQTRHEVIGAVRGPGLLNGVEFGSDSEKRKPGRASGTGRGWKDV